MATRRAIKGVLGNFLGTYVSQYSRYEGNLLFGYLVPDLNELRINLFGEDVGDPTIPTGFATQLAKEKFRKQWLAAGLVESLIREAWLTMRRSPKEVEEPIYCHSCRGFHITFQVTAEMDNGRRYQREKVAFVVPHVEFMRVRSNWMDRPRW